MKNFKFETDRVKQEWKLYKLQVCSVYEEFCYYSWIGRLWKGPFSDYFFWFQMFIPDRHWSLRNFFPRSLFPLEKNYAR